MLQCLDSGRWHQEVYGLYKISLQQSQNQMVPNIYRWKLGL